jgi:hypothetical protein
MWRRWMIRIIFMLLIPLCLVGWVWSTACFSTIQYSRGSHCLLIYTESGVSRVILGLYGDTAPDGWMCSTSASRSQNWFPRNIGGGFYDVLGIGVGQGIDAAGHWFGLAVPYWLMLLVSLVIQRFVWRKTRPSRDGHAFPVEVCESSPAGAPRATPRQTNSAN